MIQGAGLRFKLVARLGNPESKLGGYDRVWAVFCHHTASNTTPDNDCRYMWDNGRIAQSAPCTWPVTAS